MRRRGLLVAAASVWLVLGSLGAAGLLLTPAEPSDSVQTRLDQFIARYAPEYEKVRPMQEDQGAEGLRKSAGNAGHNLVVLRTKTSEQYGKLEVHRRLTIEVYTFAREEDREKALRGWFQCFDILCDPLVLHDGKGGAKMGPLLALVNPKEILVLRTRCETLGTEWTRNMTDFEERFGPGDPRIEVVGCTAGAVVTPAPKASLDQRASVQPVIDSLAKDPVSTRRAGDVPEAHDLSVTRALRGPLRASR